MIFRQLFDRDSSTYTYLLADRGEALLIDPVKAEVPKYLKLLDELGLRLVHALDTHVHADHITGLGALRDATGAATLMGEPSRAECVSRTFRNGDQVGVGDLDLRAIHTPGHTDDSYSFYLRLPDGSGRVFTGDTLMIRGCGRVDFQNGSAADQYRSLFDVLLALPDDTLVYPGHDYNGATVSTIGEERAHNPRLAVDGIEAFTALMGALNLGTPKHMHVAVPANLQCGNSAAHGG